MKPLPFIRHSLGAEELIELGRADHASNGNRPFLSDRPRMRMGQSTVEDSSPAVGGFVQDALSKDLGILGNLVLVPIDILAKSEAVTFRAVGDLLDHVPALDVLLGRIVLLGNAAGKLSLPLQEGFENILGGIAGAMATTGSGVQNQKALDEAEAAILAQASDRDAMKKLFDAIGVTGDNLIPVEFPDATPATPPPAGVQGPSVLSGHRSAAPVMLMLTRG